MFGLIWFLHLLDVHVKITLEIRAGMATNLKIRIVKNPKELNGTKRYLAENLLTSSECNSLIYVAHLFGLLGDGYANNTSPHTPNEFFGGITLNRLTFLVNLRLIDVKYLRIIVNVATKAKADIEQYFNVTNLHFSYTHLVCRSAIPGSQDERSDFSHNVHADNCNLYPNGTCIRAFPSYTSREYSAIIYLNRDIKGGDFVFVSDHKGKDVQSSIRPECGRMVAFSSGVENIHAVKAVTEGTRCAVAIWFTLIPTDAEDYEYAYTLIRDHS